MGFWIRNAIIAIILIGLGVAFFLNKDLLLSLTTEDNQTTTVNVGDSEESSVDAEKNKEKVKVKYQQGKKSTNAAAEGLSKFYAKIYGDDSKRKVRNNIIFLPDPEGDLVNLLQAKEMMVRPFRKNWSGTKVSRTFRKGETLYQKITEYASDEGVEIIWWVNKDFIVKDPFRINKNLLKTASQIGRGISGHFPEGMNTYFCYRQRTIVFISEPPTYLNDECLFLK
tara:strand:+ start:128 stop:802 length:675 start_codon:yes stop_codon:yes gene_type:complete